MLKHRLRTSCVVENPCKRYKLVMMECHEAHEGKKFRSDLKKKIYKSETNFTFENYVTKLNGIFNVLDKYGAPLHEEQELEHLLDKIMSPNIQLNTESNIYRSSHS